MLRKPKAIAIAAQPNPFAQAANSAANAFKAVGEFMYGTETRTQLTLLFTAALLAAAYAMSYNAQAMLPVCVN